MFRMILSCLVVFALLSSSVFAGEKFKVPSSREEEVAVKNVREVFQEEYAKTDSSALAEFAAKLLATSRETNDDSAGLYVLLKDAAVLAAESNATITIMACEELLRRFEGQQAGLLSPILKGISERKVKPESWQTLSTFLINLTDKAMVANDTENASKLYLMAEQAAQSAKKEAILKELHAQGKHLEALKKNADKYHAASKKVQANPNDPEACLIVGQHACFLNGDWLKGLPLLAKSSDIQLKQAASKDLESRDNDPISLLAAADTWFDILSTTDPATRKYLVARLQSLYTKALPSISGLTKLKVEKRLEEIKKQARSFAANSTLWTKVRTVVQNKSYDKLAPMGGAFGNKNFLEVPEEGGILIGFHYTLKLGGSADSIDCFQAIYQTEAGEKLGVAMGDLNASKKLTIKAKPGYAIGKMAIRGGGLWGGVNVRFMLIEGDKLSTEKSYDSGWVGHQDQPASPFLGDGRFIVGLHGKLQSRSEGICSIGLFVLPVNQEKPKSTQPAASLSVPQGSLALVR